MKKFVFCSIAAMLLAGTFCACGDDEEELDYDTIENESGGGTATETKSTLSVALLCTIRFLKHMGILIR